MKFYHVYVNNSSPFQPEKGIHFIGKYYDYNLAKENLELLEKDHKNFKDRKIYMYTPHDLPKEEYPKEDLKFWIEYK